MLKKLFPPIENANAQSPQDSGYINVQRAFWVVFVFLIVILLSIATGIYQAMQNPYWQFYANVLVNICISGLMLSAGISIRRGQAGRGLKIVYWTVLIGVPLNIFLVSGTIYILAAFTLISSFITIFLLFPPAWRKWTPFGSVTAVAIMLLVDYLNPPFRFAGEALTNIGILGSVTVAILLVSIAFLVIRLAWGGNIRVKIVTSFTVIALISVAIVGTVVYFSYRNQVREDIRQRLLNIISITALQQDGDLFATIQTVEDMQGEAYQKMEAVNHAIIATDRDLAYIFSVRVDEQGKMVFVVDSGLEEGYVPLEVGVPYDDPSALLAENTLTLDRAIVEDDFYTDEYGTFLSAYAPIYKKDGTRAGIVGVDIFSGKILEQERAVLYLILGTTLGTMVLVTLIGLFLGNLFVGPIINLSRVTQQVIDGDLGARAAVETTDEVGELAKDFNLMTSQLQETLQGLEERVADRTRNLELAAEVGRSVSQVRELDVMLREACDLILKEFDLYYVQVYLADPGQSKLVLEAGTGEVGTQLLGRGHSLPLDAGSINGRAAVEKQPVVIADTTQSAAFRQNPLLPETRSEMAVPLIIGDQVVGVLDMQGNQPGILNEDVLPAFEALAGQMAVAIQNANLLAETQQAREEVEKQARRLVRANWQDYLDSIHRPEQVGYVFEQNQILPLDDETEPQEETNLLTAPISLAGEQLGSLVIEVQEERQTQQATELANIVARQVAQQIENLRLLESAARYRLEAEQAARRLTREGWEEYFLTKTDQPLSFMYDLKEVKALESELALQAEAVLTVPVKVREETIGKLAVLDADSADPEILELVNTVSERLSEHIESLRLLEETQRGQVELNKRARQLAAVSQISTVSSRELDTQKMLATVVQMAQREFGLYHAHIFTYNEHAGHLEIVACGWQEGDENEGSHEVTVIPLDQEQSLVARAARTRLPVVVNNVRSESDWLPNPLLPETASELAVPLVIGDEVLGVLDVQSDRLNAFSDEDINIQATLAAQVATALQNARSFARAQRQAEREAMLNAISQKIQSATSVEAVLQIAARELGHALGAPRTIAQLSMKDKN